MITKSELEGREFARRMQSDEAKWRGAIRRLFSKQLKALKARINAQGSNPFGIADELGWVINEGGLYNTYLGLYSKLGYKYYKATIRVLRKKQRDYTLITKAEIDPFDPWWQFVQDYVKTEVSYRVTSVNDTTKKIALKAIQDTVNYSLENGLSIANTTKLMDKNVDAAWRNMRTYRAQRIAHTEVLSATNYASYQGAVNTDLEVTKIWLTSMDGRERASHGAANRQERPLNEPFTVGGESLMYPGDPSGSASQVIFCRCTQIYKTPDTL